MNPASPPSTFPATRWTLLQRLRSGTSAEARAALESLCRAYWHPLYCVARQKGLGEPDAQDAVQGFFEQLLRHQTFMTVDESKGKLRQLLLTSFANFCRRQWRKDHRQKRGGDTQHVEFNDLNDAASAEQRYLNTDPRNASIDVLYSRAWASAVLERSLRALKADYLRRGWEERFEQLSVPLLQQDGEISLAEIATRLGCSVGALRVLLHRMRGHYRDQIEREIATTLDTENPQLIREEMAELFRAFA